MSVDLRSNGLFARVSILLMDHYLIKLEHGRTEDRVRKVQFDSVRQVIIWHTVPWIRITLCALFLALPGVLLQLPRDTSVHVMGMILIGIGVVLIIMYAYCRTTTFRIVRGDNDVVDITGMFRPGKVKRFRERLLAGIQRVQAQASADGATVAAPQPNTL